MILISARDYARACLYAVGERGLTVAELRPHLVRRGFRDFAGTKPLTPLLLSAGAEQTGRFRRTHRKARKHPVWVSRIRVSDAARKRLQQRVGIPPT